MPGRFPEICIFKLIQEKGPSCKPGHVGMNMVKHSIKTHKKSNVPKHHTADSPGSRGTGVAKDFVPPT